MVNRLYNHSTNPTRLRRLAPALVLLTCIGPSGATPLGARRRPLTSLEHDVFTEINSARTNPNAYALLLEAWRPLYQGRRIIVLRDGVEEVEVTEEGLPALDEAVRTLRSTRARSPLHLSQALCKSADDLLRSQGPAGTVGHTAPDGSDPLARVQRYYLEPKLVGEILSYARKTGKDVVRHFLVDDGEKDRGHRKNLLNPQFGSVGVACGPHAVYGIMCVIDLGG
jgi:hypothetical protein